jgi:hypothetical protein
MRRLDFDQHEFEHPDSEERLRLCIAKKKDHPGVAEFLRCAAPDHPAASAGTVAQGWVPFSALEGKARIAHYLGRFAGLSVSGDEHASAIRLYTSIDEEDLLLEIGSLRIFYSWETTACKTEAEPATRANGVEASAFQAELRIRHGSPESFGAKG